VLDTGFVAAGDRRSAICEVELELKGGEPQALFALGRKIGGIVPFRLGVLSKSERGYRLLGPMPAVFKAEPVELDHRMNTVSSFQKIAQESLRHFCLNETILLDRQNSEALHQARVALRRLRSAFSIYKPILTDEEAERLRNELKWLASILGDARNIDVLVAKVSSNDLRRRLTEARTKAYADAVLALRSPRARALMLDLCEWLSCGEYLRAPSSEDIRSTPISNFASAALDLQRKKIKKHARDFAKADDEHRHQVRKDAKRLRYSADFFTSLFDNRKSRRRHRGFIKVMETLQDQLGALNDLAMRPHVLEKLGIEDNGSMEDATDKAELLEAGEAALADLLEAKRFWH
jgi:triphosphatase